MKATELRIGNYVYTGKFSVPRLGITSDGNTQITGEGISCVEQKILDVLPIPLTEEWLLKFGFERKSELRRVYSLNNYGFDFGLTPFFLQLIIDENIIKTTNGKKVNRQLVWIRTKCKYVHQLQNLYFTLTNKELKISLKTYEITDIDNISISLVGDSEQPFKIK